MANERLRTTATAPDPAPVVVADVQDPAVPTVAYTLSLDQLQAIVNSAVTAAVSASQVNSTTNAQALGDAIAAGIAKNAPRRKVSIGEYEARKPKLPELRRASFQNNYEMQNLSEAEILLLNRITHSGRYIDRLVEVVVFLNGSVEELHIRYNNKGDHKIQLKGKARDLTDMLTQIVTAQEAEDAEEAELKEVRDTLRRNIQANRLATAAPVGA